MENARIEKCSICGSLTAYGEMIDHAGTVACYVCRRWAKDEGRKAAEGALTRGLQNEVDRVVNAMLADLAGRD
jgi:hypothetical protein